MAIEAVDSAFAMTKPYRGGPIGIIRNTDIFRIFWIGKDNLDRVA